MAEHEPCIGATEAMALAWVHEHAPD
jgi:hypothetical protein